MTLFASVMGIGGLSLAWRRAALVWDVPRWPMQALFWLAAGVFVLVLAAYVAKWVRHPRAARAELAHPIRMAFVPTITISLIILATAGQDLLPAGVPQALWWVGAVGHLLLTVAVIGAWFERQDIGLTQVTPAWFIPVVGNVITPLAAPHLGSTELAWFAFGVGLMFWLALLPLLLLRVLLHSDPLPLKLLPTIAIFVAPPAVAGISWVTLQQQGIDPVVRILYAATLAFLVIAAAQLPRLVHVPFGLPYWAYTFPLAAAAAFTTLVAGGLESPTYDVIAVGVLALATGGVADVAALTLRAVARREICVPE
ncbi:MAG: SLAC1 anion channel family protein [Nocardioides sp.]